MYDSFQAQILEDVSCESRNGQVWQETSSNLWAWSKENEGIASQDWRESRTSLSLPLNVRPTSISSPTSSCLRHPESIIYLSAARRSRSRLQPEMERRGDKDRNLKMGLNPMSVCPFCHGPRVIHRSLSLFDQTGPLSADTWDEDTLLKWPAHLMAYDDIGRPHAARPRTQHGTLSLRLPPTYPSWRGAVTCYYAVVSRLD